MKIIVWLIIIGIIYWKHKEGLRALPPHLRYTWHKDYTFPLCFIPRTLTSYATKPPKLLWGYNATSWGEYNGIKFPHPIQNKLNGKRFAIQICWMPFIQFTLWNGYYFYFGFRYDGVDYYSTFLGVDISKAEGFKP
jgi:hypothetical protein